jgi:hypothetical protein
MVCLFMDGASLGNMAEMDVPSTVLVANFSVLPLLYFAQTVCYSDYASPAALDQLLICRRA